MTQYKHTQKSKLSLNQAKKVKRVEERLSKMIQMKTQLGHKSLNFFGNRLWHPEMSNSFLGIRDGVTIIDPEITLKATAEGLYFASLILRNKGRLLLVDSRHEFSPFSYLASKYTDKIDPAIAIAGNRWIGGTLTNWSSISAHVSQFGFITSMFKPFVNNFRVTSPRYKKK